jgi:hypothetical protein
MIAMMLLIGERLDWNPHSFLRGAMTPAYSNIAV